MEREKDSASKVWALAALLIVLGVGAGLWIEQRGPMEKPESYQPPETPSMYEGIVAAVHEGDLISVADANGTQTVRLLGIDAPEVGVCGAAEARQFVVDGLLHRDVTVMNDLGAPDRDDQGNLLRYVIVERVGDFSTHAAGSGWVRSQVVVPELRKAAQILKAEEIAMKNQWGVWGPTCVPAV
jgi:endonuclease YncB( thermonuclease family)